MSNVGQGKIYYLNKNDDRLRDISRQLKQKSGHYIVILKRRDDEYGIQILTSNVFWILGESIKEIRDWLLKNNMQGNIEIPSNEYLANYLNGKKGYSLESQNNDGLIFFDDKEHSFLKTLSGCWLSNIEYFNKEILNKILNIGLLEYKGEINNKKRKVINSYIKTYKR